MTLDGTGERKDESHEDTSGGKQKTSEQAITYDQKALDKIVSDKLAAAGRDAKALETARAELKEREEAHERWQKERDEEAYEAARGKPEELNILTERKKIRDDKAQNKKDRDQIEKDKLELQVKLDAIKAAETKAGVVALAEKYKVDAADLDFPNLDMETLEKLAQKLTTLSPEELAKVTKQSVAPKKKRDSGMTNGSGEKSQEDKLKELYPSMYPK